MTTTNDNKLTIAIKLNDENCVLWEFAMITMLKVNGLYQHVVPIQSATGQVAAETTTEPKVRARAMYAITRNMEQDQLPLILAYRDDLVGA